MNTRRLTALVTALITLGFAAQALALDGYRDRRGLFYGLGLGGGSFQLDEDNADSSLGFHLRGRIGGGVNERVTLDGELGWRFHSEERNYGLGEVTLDYDIITAFVGGSFFVFDGLYIRAMGGLAHMIVEAETTGGITGSGEDSETGLGLGFGVGYEFFATSDLAIGIGADYQLLMFDEADASLINFGVQATWY